MLLFIVRHGQSTGNVSSDDIPDGVLTTLGEQQAREVATRLAGERLTHVLSSPLVRALATATSIVEAAPGALPIEVWPELQEHRDAIHRAFGREELLRRFPRAVLPHTIEADGWDHGGENYQSVAERGRAALAMLRKRFGHYDRVAVATHGAFANYLLRAILHMPDTCPIWLAQNNCAINIIEFIPPERVRPDGLIVAETQVYAINEVAHLSEVS